MYLQVYKKKKKIYIYIYVNSVFIAIAFKVNIPTAFHFSLKFSPSFSTQKV